jgi:acyl-[acyl-carrier-protein]-phospholipid O-acyltransferase/long-chain-fatty-acid--[acyl-carrier-protein] ligase
VGELTGRYRATLLIGTPTFMSAYTRKCTRDQFSSLRLIVTGAEKLKQTAAEAVYQKFGVPPLEGYGCTELSPVVSLGIPSYIHPEGKFIQVGNKPGTVGHPIPGVAARIVHPETFDPLPAGNEGLLLIKGPNVMKGYLNNTEQTADVIRDGWYVTGDIAAIDEDGFIAITDRLSRFSKIAGEMVPHVKIEEEILAALEVSDPVCAVTAVPDERKGERVVVLYTGDIDVDQLWRKLNERDIPKLWIPKKDCFCKVDTIPLLGSGKLDLKKIRDVAERSVCR